MFSLKNLAYGFTPLFSCCLAFCSLAQLSQAQTINAASPDYFETKIRPILANNCYGCHTNSALGGLRLDSAGGHEEGRQARGCGGCRATLRTAC